MSVKRKGTEADPVIEPVQATEPVFTKEQILASKRFEANRDALTVALKTDRTYTFEDVQSTLDAFMKGKVN